MKSKKIVLSFVSLSLLTISPITLISCSKTNLNKQETDRNSVIEEINQLNSRNEIKLIKNSFTLDEYNKIDSSNILSYVVLPSNINKKELSVINFKKNAKNISFKVKNDNNESNMISFVIDIKNDILPPTTNWSKLILEEKIKWNDYVFPQQELTLNELNDIKNNHTQKIEYIVENENILDIDHFAYEFNVQNINDSVISFRVLIYPDSYPEYSEFSIDKKINYIIKQESQDDLQLVANKLNAINWNNFNYSKFSQSWLTFRDLSNIAYDPGYVLNFINDFDPNDFSRLNSVDLKINSDSFKLDILKQVLKFKISILKDGKSIETNEYTIVYKTPQNQLSILDGDNNTDPSIKITNSLKGILTILPSKLSPLSESLFRNRHNKFFNTKSNEMNRQFKYLEMLYQARFIFYQSFGDNASSINYGIENNKVIFKAKIKDTITIRQPYIQVLNDTNNLSNLTLNEGEIISIILTPSNINDSWEIINNDSGLGGGSTPFLYGKGPERVAILNGNNLVSFGQNLKKWNISINVNQKSIVNQSIVWRIMFCFCVPCIKR